MTKLLSIISGINLHKFYTDVQSTCIVRLFGNECQHVAIGIACSTSP